MGRRSTEQSPLRRKLYEVKRLRRTQLIVRSLGEAVGLGLIPILIALLLIKLTPWQYDLVLFGEIAGGVIALAWFLWQGVLRRISVVECSREADDKLRLKDRLTSALLLERHSSEDEFVAALVKDAEASSEAVRPREVFPWQFPKSWRLSGVSALLTLAIFFVPFLGWLESPGQESERQQVKEAGKRLIQLAREVEKRDNRVELSEAKKLSKKIEKLGKQFDLGKFKKGKALEKLNELKNEINEASKSPGNEAKEKFLSDMGKKMMQLEGMRNIGLDLKSGNLERLFAELSRLQKKFEAGELSKSDLESLEEMMNALEEALESNSLLDEESEFSELKSQLNNLLNNKELSEELRKRTEKRLAELKDAVEKLVQELRDNGLNRQADEISKAMDAIESEFKESGRISDEAIEKLGEKVQSANEKMQAGNKAQESKDAVQARTDDVMEKLQGLKLENSLLAGEANMLKVAEMLKMQMDDLMQKLDDAVQSLCRGLKANKMGKEADAIGKSMKNMLDKYNADGSISREELANLRSQVVSANEKMQAGGASKLQKELIQGRTDEVLKLIDGAGQMQGMAGALGSQMGQSLGGLGNGLGAGMSDAALLQALEAETASILKNLQKGGFAGTRGVADSSWGIGTSNLAVQSRVGSDERERSRRDVPDAGNERTPIDFEGLYRPETTPKSSYNTRVRGQFGEGGTTEIQTYTALPTDAEGMVAYYDIVEAYTGGEEQAMEEENIPNEYRDLVKDYFSELNDPTDGLLPTVGGEASDDGETEVPAGDAGEDGGE